MKYFKIKVKENHYLRGFSQIREFKNEENIKKVMRIRNKLKDCLYICA